MKIARFRGTAVLLGVLLLTGPAVPTSAQGGATSPSTTSGPTDAEAAEIRRLIDAYVRSIDRADTTLGAEVWATSQDATFIHPRGHERGWQQVKKNFYEGTMGAFFAGRKLSVKDVTIHTYGDTAWAEFYWDFVAKMRADGKPLTSRGRETQIYRRTNDGWKLVHVHYSGMPVTGDRQGF